jgi:type II secretory pathway pseudopilin PulG
MILRLNHLSSLSRSKSQAAQSEAFTLVEMLISLIILATLIVSGAYFITHLTYTSNIGTKQKSVEEWGRVDYLLETDIREAKLAAVGSIPASATCLSSPSTPALGLLTADGKAIVYYNSTDNGKPAVRRCGPDVNPDGTLATSFSDNIAFHAATLNVVSADNLFIDYTITLTTPPVTEQGYARLRSRVP